MTTVFFALSCVIVFAFGFVRDGRAIEDAAAGILWIAIAFYRNAGSRTRFERERQGDTLRALMMAPVERPALYVGSSRASWSCSRRLRRSSCRSSR